MGDELKPPTNANPEGFFECEKLGKICRSSYREP